MLRITDSQRRRRRRAKERRRERLVGLCTNTHTLTLLPTAATRHTGSQWTSRATLAMTLLIAPLTAGGRESEQQRQRERNGRRESMVEECSSSPPPPASSTTTAKVDFLELSLSLSLSHVDSRSTWRNPGCDTNWRQRAPHQGKAASQPARAVSCSSLLIETIYRPLWPAFSCSKCNCLVFSVCVLVLALAHILQDGDGTATEQRAF